MISDIQTKDDLRQKILGEICYCRDLKMSWLEHFPGFNKQRVGNKNVLGRNFFKNLISVVWGVRLLQTSEKITKKFL